MKKDKIIIDHVSFSYKHSEPVIKDISLEIAQRESVGILGPNGGGKSTFLKLLLGLLRPGRGTLSLFGKTPKQYRSFMSYVPQHLMFDKEFPISVREVMLMSRLSHLKWHGRYTKEDEEIIDKSLKILGMLPYKFKSFSHLSGGQAQRILIARALASEPHLLILDEPTANIDFENQKKIYETLKILKKTMTIIMVTHDLHHAMNLFDKTYYFNSGVSPVSQENLCQNLFCSSNETD